MSRIENLAIAKLSESLVDAEAIAKSMVGNAVARSCDLNVNPVITLLVMKALSQLAIDDYAIHFNTKHAPGPDFLDNMEDMIVSVITAGYERHKRESNIKL